MEYQPKIIAREPSHHEIGAAALAEIDQLLSHYPQPQGAAIDALTVVQKYRGWVSDHALKQLAEHMSMPVAELESVATFYNLIFRREVGKTLLHPCNGLSCQLLGYKSIQRQLRKEINIDEGETSANGSMTLISLPCLGACDKAPVMLLRESTATINAAGKAVIRDKLLTHITTTELSAMLDDFQEFIHG